MNYLRNLVSKMSEPFNNSNVRVHPKEDFPERDLFDIIDDNGYVITPKNCPPVVLNDDVLTAILANVPPKDLVKSCRRVCKLWCNIIDEEVWKEKLRQSQLYRHNPLLRGLPWHIKFWLLESNCLNRNLIKNPCGEKGMKDWTIRSEGGDKWRIEKPPQGADEPHPAESCFATSFHSCSKEQRIDLVKEGAVPALMDLVQPAIHISEWVAGRWDCHAVYDIEVELISDEDIIIAEFRHRELCGGHHGANWRKIEHVFKNYGPGVRFIRFYHGGTDGQFWAGHYGSKMTAADVTIAVTAPEAEAPAGESEAEALAEADESVRKPERSYACRRPVYER